MTRAHILPGSALLPSRSVARLALVTGELVTAIVIVVGGGWLTALASLR